MAFDHRENGQTIFGKMTQIRNDQFPLATIDSLIFISTDIDTNDTVIVNLFKHCQFLYESQLGNLYLNACMN
jgi:hypothetical protein